MSTYRFNCGCENEVEFQHAGAPGALANVRRIEAEIKETPND